MAYATTTYAQFRTALAARLSDTGKVFWTDTELKEWTLEALRTWSAYSSYWRERGTFATVAATSFYDIAVQLPTLLAYTVTDTQLTTDINFQLMEDVAASTIFSASDITAAIQRRRDQFLTETGSVLSMSTMAAPATPVGRFTLDEHIIDVRRVAWNKLDPNTGLITNTIPLFRVDELQLDFARPSWSVNQATPEMYSTIVSPPLTVQLAPAPIDTGSMDLLTVNSGAVLTGGVALGIPDDFAWVVKWGALADLLGMDGQARDPDRATYCEMRWRQGVE